MLWLWRPKSNDCVEMSLKGEAEFCNGENAGRGVNIKSNDPDIII